MIWRGLREPVLLDKIPDFYERLKRELRREVYEQEVLGEYLSMQAGWFISSFRGRKRREDVQADASAPAAVGAGFQRGSDVLGSGAGAWGTVECWTRS